MSSRKTAKIETAAELEAMSKAQLADAYGPLATKLKPLEKRAELFKKEFKRRGASLLVGENYSVQRSESSPYDGIDIVKAKAALGAEWCEANKKPVVRVSWNVAELTDEAASPAEAAA
jgi:hypothetical protein